MMESSRIFVRGLPPNITPGELKHQFAQISPVTDIKCIPQRRIGYVGYKSPAEAAKAIKYFNKSFIRSSRIYVEQARPIEDQHDRRVQNITASTKASVNLASLKNSDAIQESTKKRKRDQTASDEQEPQPSERPLSKAKYDQPIASSAPQTTTSSGPRQSDAVDNSSEGDAELETRSHHGKPLSLARNSEDSSREQSEKNTKDLSDGPQSAHEAQIVSQHVSAATDEDWLRSRTSRLLGLLDEEETLTSEPSVAQEVARGHQERRDPSPLEEPIQIDVQPDKAPLDRADQPIGAPAVGKEEIDLGTGRLFVRNLSYGTTNDEVRSFFESQGHGLIEEVHVPSNRRAGTSKGYAYIQFAEPQAANNALQAMDGKSFQGRLLHVIPAAHKTQTSLDEFALSKLPIKKQQQIRRKAEAASSTFNWNAMFMNADAVMSSISDRLGVPKSQLLDPTSSDAAVKQAHAETHILQDTKAYFTSNGVDLNAFKKGARGDTAILVKNFSYDTKASDLKALFESHGPVSRLLVPPSGTIAIVEFKTASDAQSAFAALAYRKVKDSILFLEKAPRGLFADKNALESVGSTSKPNATTPEDANQEEPIQTSTLYVRNLNFVTTTEYLRETFKPLDGFLSARVKEKPDPKKPGHSLSMGFGFVEFRSKQQAQAALVVMNDYLLDGHKLLVKASHKGLDAAEERRNEDKAKKLSGLKTKLIIKNLPFEASKKDVRSLLGHYGQLRSVRVPKKFNTSTRGFAFAEFVTAKEAANAVESLKDTHLLGRRLVFEYAAQEAVDPEQEIAKMQRKVGKQADKVALQTLTGTGRRKFNVDGDEEQ